MSKTILTDSSTAINKEQIIATLSSSIAHEVRNYLTVISICTEISGKQLDTIRNRIKAADYLIGNLQLQIEGVIAGKPDTKDLKRYSMAKNIEETLEQYPFQKDEQEIITVDIKRDFEYMGNPS